MYVRVFQVLADPMRFRIVEALRTGERSVNDLVAKVAINQSGVSRHLRILQQAGFVRVRPAGQQRFYSLCPQPFRDMQGWIDGYRQFWETRLDKFAEALQQKQAARPGKKGRSK